MLTSYAGVVKKGQIHLGDEVNLPEGAQVIVVVAERPLSLEEQERYLHTLSAADWSRLFNEFMHFSSDPLTEVDIETISDAELVAIVHEVRATRQ
jgi:hypothetical protein